MHADPDGSTTDSRGAWADEGQYTVQARNFVHHGDWTLDASDALLKTPLFSVMQYIGFSIFGVSLFHARLFVLLLILACMLIAMHMGDYYSEVARWTIPLAFSHWLVFQYAHYSLAELPAISCIWLSLGCLLKSEDSEKVLSRYLLVAWSLLLLAVFFKIQFGYILFLMPVYSLLCLTFLPGGVNRGLYLRRLVLYLVFAVIAASLVGFLWIKPNTAIFSSLIRSQVEGRFIPFNKLNVWGILFEMVHNAHKLFFSDNSLILFSSLYLMAFLIGVWLIRFKSCSRLFHLLFLLLMAWQSVELHKLFLLHAPARYLVSVYFPMACLLGLVTSELVRMRLTKSMQVISLVPYALLICLQLNQFYQAYSHRTFETSALNSYIKKSGIQNGVILGQWAPAVTWQVDALTLPYIQGLTGQLNKELPCRLIVSEVGEEAELGEMLNLLPPMASIDSTSYRQFGAWQLRFTWLR